MKLSTFLLAVLLGSCATRQQKDIFVVPFERKSDVVKVDLDTVKHPIVFSDAFWNHFTSTFPSASITLFSRRGDDYDNYIELSDSAYSYGLISSRHKIFFVNHLPKNLSKEESESYREGLGFFIIPDSPAAAINHEPEVTLERHWNKAPQEVEKEYLQFYSLITGDGEYMVVAKKALIDSILKKYQ